MPDPTPATVLRTAAATLRTAARSAGGSDWLADHFPEGTVVRPADSIHSLFQLHADGIRAAGTPCISRPVGAWIALMDPGMGPLLADWLDDVADGLDANTHPGWQECLQPRAFAIARKINSKEMDR